MAYLGTVYGDTSFDFNSMKNNYNSLYNPLISSGLISDASGGVDAGLLNHFVDQYFNRASVPNNIPGLSNFIAAGGNNFALATYSTGNGTGHEFVITSMTSNQYIGWDAQNQKPVSIDKNLISAFSAIIGVCH